MFFDWISDFDRWCCWFRQFRCTDRTACTACTALGILFGELSSFCAGLTNRWNWTTEFVGLSLKGCYFCFHWTLHAWTNRERKNNKFQFSNSTRKNVFSAYLKSSLWFFFVFRTVDIGKSSSESSSVMMLLYDVLLLTTLLTVDACSV